jgi:hypothetical protein
MADEEEEKLEDILSNAGQPPGSKELETATHGLPAPSRFLNPTPGLPQASAPSKQPPLGDLRAEMAKLMAEPSAAPKAKTAEIIPPSSPAVQAAINRLQAWLPINERNGPNNAIRMNIEILKRGGPMAEGLARHTLNTWKEPPGKALPPPTIEGD